MQSATTSEVTAAAPESTGGPSAQRPSLTRRTHPALWVPTLYFAEGLPYVTVSVVAALMYKNEEEGFYAGLVYGVLFPFQALSLPADIYTGQFANGAGTAQTFQARLYVKF